MILRVDDSVEMHLLNKGHAPALLHLRNENYDYLAEWLPWVPHMQAVTDFENYIERSLQRFADKLEAPFTLMVNGEVAGRIGINYIDQNKMAAIGYWIGAPFQGKGVITKACKALVDYGFKYLGLNRLELKCGVENHKSKAIPERLGFTQEGILRQAELINGRYIDLYLYSLLKKEWLKSRG